MGWFSRKQDQSEVGTDVDAAASRQPPPVVRPPWVSADDWAARVEAYARQGHLDAEVREIAANLQKRGPGPTRAQIVANAKQQGHVSRQEFMPPDIELRALALDADGLPDARLERVRDRLLVATALGWVNPRSRTSYRAGLHSVTLRGSSYHAAAVKAGRFTPGSPVRLEREPDNEHDPNAIAIHAGRARNRAGYVPRGQAKRLAKLIDAGRELVAVSTLGSGAGRDTVTPVVLICERPLFEHLTR